MRTLRVSVLLLTALLMGPVVMAQGPEAGRQVFAARCAGCHGSDGNGGELGPGIATRVPARTDQELSTVFRQGFPASSMPSFANLSDNEVASLTQFLRTLKPRGGSAPERAKGTVGGT